MEFVYWVLWLIFMFISGLLHELGHGAMSRIFFNDKGWVITMGSGPPIFSSKRLTINLWFFMPGKIDYSVYEGKRGHQIARAAGGFSVNIILSILIFLFANWYSSHVYELQLAVSAALFVNILYAIITMLPITYSYGIVKGMPSDGLYILRIIKNRNKDAKV